MSGDLITVTTLGLEGVDDFCGAAGGDLAVAFVVAGDVEEDFDVETGLMAIFAAVDGGGAVAFDERVEAAMTGCLGLACATGIGFASVIDEELGATVGSRISAREDGGDGGATRREGGAGGGVVVNLTRTVGVDRAVGEDQGSSDVGKGALGVGKRNPARVGVGTE